MPAPRDLRDRLQRVLAVGVALSAERDFARLLVRILETAQSLCDADAGTLYRVVDEQLHFEVVRNQRLGLHGNRGDLRFDPVPLHFPDGTPNHAMVVAHAALEQKTIVLDDAYTADSFDFSGTRAFDARTGYRSTSFLTVPMVDAAGDVIGVLQLINALDADDRVRPFDADDILLVESLASQAAVALHNRILLEQQERLFKSFAEVINKAIDEKSPHTAGHCTRVPALTLLLCDAAARTTTGPLADFRMDEDERYEIEIASLLHDCGKITTPVHVIEKATKLQTIFDRIELVDLRFQILLRDLRHAALEPEARTRAERALLAARDLLHRHNAGTEFMDDAAIAAIRDVAARTWTDHEGSVHPLLTPDELENLSVRKGTLTADERHIIDRHIVLTLDMLEAMPWPRHLEHVPEIAGGHHERMDGRGHPRGLRREQMSIPARIMGIADVFEALTASDRPYKPGMKLSQALTILGRMAVDGHIDPDLFAVFVRERVYLHYARRYLPEAQIDAIPWDQIPGLDPTLRTELAVPA